MQITRKQIRAMILKEMADILPFSGPIRRGGMMGGEMGGAEIFNLRPAEFRTATPEETHISLLDAVNKLVAALMDYGGSRAEERLAGRRGVGAPAVRSAAGVMNAAEEIRQLGGDIETCAEEYGDEICMDAMGLVNTIESVLDAYDEDPSTASAGATRLMNTLRMSSSLVRSLRDSVGSDPNR